MVSSLSTRDSRSSYLFFLGIRLNKDGHEGSHFGLRTVVSYGMVMNHLTKGAILGWPMTQSNAYQYCYLLYISDVNIGITDVVNLKFSYRA